MSIGGHSTNYNTTDNRSNYVDVTSGGAATTDLHVGDEIGQNTNSIGSMNTGTTNIDVNGNANSIVATNSADNTGCVDGSALTNTMTMPDLTGSLGLSGAVAGGGLGSLNYGFGHVASPLQDCAD